MKNKNTIHMNSFLFLSFFIVMTPQKTTANNWGSATKGVMTAGAVLAGIGGILMFADWLTSESDEKLLDRVAREYNDAYHTFHDDVYWFESKAGMRRLTASERKRVLYNWSEDMLYAFAVNLWNNNHYQSDYRRKLLTAVNKLEKGRAQLIDRIRKIEQKGQYDFHVGQTLSEMKKLIKTIESYLPHIGLFFEFIEHHKSYFQLFEAEGIINNYYHKEQKILKKYGAEYYQLEQELGYCVVQKNGGRYPFIDYIYQLDMHINELYSGISSVAYNYVSRLSVAQILYDSLKDIRSVIVSSGRYSQELRDREHEQREQERTRIMREQVKAEKEKARALQKRNHLKERELAIKECEHYYGNCSDSDIEANITIHL